MPLECQSHPLQGEERYLTSIFVPVKRNIRASFSTQKRRRAHLITTVGIKDGKKSTCWFLAVCEVDNHCICFIGKSLN